MGPKSSPLPAETEDACDEFAAWKFKEQSLGTRHCIIFLPFRSISGWNDFNLPLSLCGRKGQIP
jgi:hypothetical protein